MDILKIRNSIIKKVDEKSPEILIGVGLAGMLTSTILAVKATPKALDIIERESEEEELTNLDKVKLTWKYYVPSAIGYLTSAACIVGAHSVNVKRNIVMASVCKVSETALMEYRDKVTEMLGEEKEREIRESVAKDRVERDFSEGKQVVVVEQSGVLCYDTLSGRYFNSEIDKIERAVNTLNYRLMNENIISLNEFYSEIGLSNTDLGYSQGWDVAKGLIEVSFSSVITENNKPCIIIDFDNPPRYGFDKFL